MNNKLGRIFALVLVLVMSLSLTACNDSSNTTSTDVEYIIEEEIVNVQNDNDKGSNTSSNNSSVSDTSSDENIIVAPPYELSEIEKLRGTTVKFAVTSDPMQSEKAYVINNFEKEYGIKIEPVIISGDFISEITGLIAAGNSPDVVRSSGDFPLSLMYLQSLDAAKLDYNDPIWEQGMFKLTTIGGSPYLCTTEGNVYTESDIVVYRKDILQKLGCKTPEQYDAEGNWTIDVFFEIARKCNAKCSFVNYDSAFHMSGNSVFKLENGKFTNGLNNSASAVISKLSAAKKEGLVTINSTNGIVSGSVVIATHHSYALRKTGAFEDNPEIWNKLGFYYLPSYDNTQKGLKTGLVRGWGLVKGAPNPVAAGAFLGYYLNPNYCDVNNMYITPEAETFFFKATDIDYNNWIPYFTYGNKLSGVCELDFNKDVYKILDASNAQLDNQLSALIPKIDDACENLNYFVAQESYKD